MLFSPLQIEGMNEKAMQAHIHRARIEFRLHRLPISAKYNVLREQLHQEHARLSRVVAENRNQG